MALKYELFCLSDLNKPIRSWLITFNPRGKSSGLPKGRYNCSPLVSSPSLSLQPEKTSEPISELKHARRNALLVLIKEQLMSISSRSLPIKKVQMKNALIVDDDPMIHILVSKMLEVKGFNVKGYKSYNLLETELVSSPPMLKPSDFNIFLLDMQLGSITGDMVFSLLESHCEVLPPVLYMSSNSDSEARDLFEMRAPNSLFLQKPFAAAALYSSLSTLGINLEI